LILDESFFSDSSLLKQLGNYLNKNNFLGHGNGPHQVALHSIEHTREELCRFAESLKSLTWNSVSVPSTFDSVALPESRDLDHAFQAVSTASSLKLTENFTHLRAEEPPHTAFLDPQLKSYGRGQWIVELVIERHNNLSKYSNVVDVWELPARNKVARAFTKDLARPTRHGRLAIMPSSTDTLLRSRAAGSPSYYDLLLPSDEEFFRHLALNFHRYPDEDVRSSLPKHGYVDIAVSDKGQNLRGVIAMFGQLSVAHEVIANAYWRKVLDAAPERSAAPRIFSIDKLRSLAVDDRDSLVKIAGNNGLKDAKEARKFLQDGLLDTLENLIRAKVFFQIFGWRCGYCGHANSKLFDDMRIKNECAICSTTFHAPIDIEWAYELNAFVHRSLKLNGGLPVMWTLGHLLDRSSSRSFWFLPEVDLFPEVDSLEKNEIDSLCIEGGKFYAVEVKRSVTTFLNAPGGIEKFCMIISRLRPDVAMLSFERYTNDGVDGMLAKQRLADAVAVIRERIAPWTQLEILVAEDVGGFDDVPYDLGWGGSRVRSLDIKRSMAL